MEEFSTFKERPTRYYVFLSVYILYPILFLFILFYQGIADKYVFITCVLVFSGMIAIIVGMMITVTKGMYIVEGKLTLSPDEICFNEVSTPISEIENVELDANDCCGGQMRSVSDGSGNKISILFKDKKRSTFQFVIESRDQRSNLREIVKQWKEDGVPVGQMGFGRN